MKRACCDHACSQGRACPLRTVRIPTRRSIPRRVGAAIWQALEDHKWLPMVVALVAIYFINS